MYKNKPLVLLILDGWGYREESDHNAIALAHTPQWGTWWSTYPHILLDASGEAVGLPNAQMGNSEVGHMHIGAGRVVLQDLTRINKAIACKQFFKNAVLINLIEQSKAQNKRLHVMGLLSAGGVHSHENHLFAFLALCYELDFHKVCLHLFLDGRDTAPKSAAQSLSYLSHAMQIYPVATINSITGRYFAMDRDLRWERTAVVYSLLTAGISNFQFNTATAALEYFYAQDITDEFIPPTIIGQPAIIEDNDAIFFFNFRADRARQLTHIFQPSFSEFQRNKYPYIRQFVTMTQYANRLNTICVFPPIILKNTIGEMLAKHGLTQLRIAETEKYAHVTYFFNGGVEKRFPQEDRILIPSPQVATYNLQPKMSAEELTERLIKVIECAQYDVIICNYANADMVGHTGNFAATIKAIECLDNCMHKLWQVLSKQQGSLLITADHGNAELMFDKKTSQANTAHTSQPVPLLFVGKHWSFIYTTGSLIDIAPTILMLLGIQPPQEMTGRVLLSKDRISI